MIHKIKPIWYLVMGILSMTAVHMSYSIDIIAWIAYVPFLMYLSLTEGLKSRLLFVLALIIAWSFVTAKIITPPIPFVMVFLYAIPISLFHLPAYLIWDKNDKIMIAELPVKGVTTVYSVIGDVFIYLCMGFVLSFFLIRFFKKV
jgi:apolipoprotein N-acyltransferase